MFSVYFDAGTESQPVANETKVELTQDEWTEIIHTGDEKKDEILIAAYMQFLLNQVTENTKSNAKYYDERNKQYE